MRMGFAEAACRLDRDRPFRFNGRHLPPQPLNPRRRRIGSPLLEVFPDAPFSRWRLARFSPFELAQRLTIPIDACEIQIRSKLDPAGDATE